MLRPRNFSAHAEDAESMISAGVLSWFGVGLFFFASAPRLWQTLRAEIPNAARWALRVFGFAALLASVRAIESEAPGALAFVGALLAVMASSSVAALLAPLRPRLYAASVPLAALFAAACLLGR